MYGLIIAFKDYNMRLGYWGSQWVGLENFQRLFTSNWFPIILKNTLTLSTLGLIIGFPLPIILALLVNEIGNEKVKRTFQTVSYAPHFISTVVICGMVILFLNPSHGILNLLITALGGEATAFMQEPESFKWVYVLSGVWQGTGWGTIIYFAALSGVDKNLIDAATVDGASRLQIIRYVNFPALIPTIMIMLILQCGQLLSIGYEKTLLLQNSLNISASEVISTYVYKMGLENMDYSFSTAAGLFNSLCNTVILVAANTFSKKATDSSLW
jgi:putative aldouronate transport system permease protein